MNFQWLKLLSCIFSFAIYLTGCATNPVTGKKEITLVSVAQEKQLGVEEAVNIEKTMGFVDNPHLTEYVRAIGKRLAKNSPYQDVEYQFNIVNIYQPNAFALPGGYVYVSRGLLALANSEAEIAGVIGHEIGHIAARHAVQRMTRSAPIGLVTGITSMATGIVSSSLAGAVSETGKMLNSAILAPYSREQENDADKIGQQLAAEAGWDPRGITHYLNTLDRQQALIDQSDHGFSFLSTHPATPDRVQATEQRADTIEREKSVPIAANHKAFLNYLNGLKLGDDVYQGVFQKQLFLHPDMQFSLQFPAQWKTQNQTQFVAAISLQEDSALVIQSQGSGEDPMQAAQAYLGQLKLGSQLINPIKTNGLYAARTEINQNGQFAVITWVAINGQILRITGIDKSRNFVYRKSLLEAMDSFHRITSQELKSIKQSRLRIIQARSNETLAKLLKRTSSTWDEAYCATANDLSAGVRLKQGQLIKVAKDEALGF